MSHRPTDPDLELVRDIARGDGHALAALYAQYGRRLLSYLIGQVGDSGTAEDLLQEVMLAVWKGAPQFRGDSRVYTWMLRIARNKAINARTRAAPSTLPLDDELASASDDPRPDLRAALNALSQDQRETLDLVFFHRLSLEDTAAVMGVALGTVKSRLHRAKAALRHQLVHEAVEHE